MGVAPSPTPYKSEVVICAARLPEGAMWQETPIGQTIERAISRPAVTYGSGYAPQPDLLRELPSEANGSLRREDDGTISVILRYREGLVWSDGEPFKTTDAVMGFKTANTDGSVTVIDAQEGDALTVFLRLPSSAEYPYVPDNPPLSSRKLNGIDPATIMAHDFATLENPTLGPYFVTEESPGQTIVLVANPHYTPAPIIPSVRVRFVDDLSALPNELIAGGCDAALSDSLALDELPALLDGQASGGLRVTIVPGRVHDQLAFNTYTGATGRAAYFADSAVRQAVAYAFDRASLGAILSTEMPPLMDSWLPAEHWAYAPGGFAAYGLDVTRAQSLLDQAGWSDQDGDGVREYHGEGGGYSCQRGDWQIAEGAPLSPALLFPTGDPIRAQIVEKLRSDLAQAGIAIQLQAVDPEVMFAPDGPVIRREFDLALLTTVTGPDPGGINQWVGADVFMHPLDKTAAHRWQLEDRWLTSDQLVERLALSNIPAEANDFQGQNFGGWCDEQADLIIVQASRALDAASKLGLYAQHQQLVAAAAPIIPLYARPRLTASAVSLCGLDPGPYDPVTWNIAQWSFDPQGLCGSAP